MRIVSDRKRRSRAKEPHVNTVFSTRTWDKKQLITQVELHAPGGHMNEIFIDGGTIKKAITLLVEEEKKI